MAFLQMWALTPNLPCVGMLKQVTGGKLGKKSDVEVLGTWRERLSSDQPVAQKLTNDLFFTDNDSLIIDQLCHVVEFSKMIT